MREEHLYYRMNAQIWDAGGWKRKQPTSKATRKEEKKEKKKKGDAQ